MSNSNEYGHFQGNSNKAIDSLTGIIRYQGLTDAQRTAIREVRIIVEDVRTQVPPPKDGPGTGRQR